MGLVSRPPLIFRPELDWNTSRPLPGPSLPMDLDRLLSCYVTNPRNRTILTRGKRAQFQVRSHDHANHQSNALNIFFLFLLFSEETDAHIEFGGSPGQPPFYQTCDDWRPLKRRVFFSELMYRPVGTVRSVSSPLSSFS